MTRKKKSLTAVQKRCADRIAELEAELAEVRLEVAAEAKAEVIRDLEEFSGDADGIDYKPKYEELRARIDEHRMLRDRVQQLRDDVEEWGRRDLLNPSTLRRHLSSMLEATPDAAGSRR